MSALRHEVGGNAVQADATLLAEPGVCLEGRLDVSPLPVVARQSQVALGPDPSVRGPRQR